MKPRFLTKTRFKLALECPSKLYYTGRDDYVDTSAGNSFMEALAEGGYQVGALACAMYPEGIEVADTNHEAALARTQQLLQQESVTIFEAAVQAQGLFVRVDILRKRGQSVEIIEVKAKSYDPSADAGFRGARGQLDRSWLPYLNDVAFQCHVAQLALPTMEVRGFLMLADKSAPTSVDGLNQLFPVHRDPASDRKLAKPARVDAAALGDAILTCVSVDDAIHEIHSGTVAVEGQQLKFAEAVTRLAEACRSEERLQTKPGTHCSTLIATAISLRAASGPPQ